MAEIVVDVDHSEGAKAALRFAPEEAKLRQATLEPLREAILETGTLEIERRVFGGLAAAIPVDESRRTDLLVVSSRGHGGFAGPLPGSVSRQCAPDGACPVAIVHRSPER